MRTHFLLIFSITLLLSGIAVPQSGGHAHSGVSPHHHSCNSVAIPLALPIDDERAFRHQSVMSEWWQHASYPGGNFIVAAEAVHSNAKNAFSGFVTPLRI